MILAGRPPLAASLLLGLLSAVIYSNTLDAPFVFDDTQNIEENPLIRVTSASAGALWRVAVESPKRPIAFVSFALNHAFDGYRVYGYHLVNVAIHAANGMLVFLAAAQLLAWRPDPPAGHAPTPDFGWAALFAAAIFVAHPAQTQSVSYVVQRMNGLSVMFYLAAFLLFVRGRHRGPLRRGLLWSGCGVCWLLALGSKEIAITLPLILLLHEWFFERDLRLDWVRSNKRWIATGTAVVVAAAFWLAKPSLFDYSQRDFSPSQRLLTESRVIVSYLSLLLYPRPSRFSLTHDVAVSTSVLEPATTLPAILLLVALLGTALVGARRQRVASFAVLWFFVNLALESSIIPLELMYEHRLYLPMFGFSLLVAVFVEWLAERSPRSVTAGCVLLIGVLAAGAHARNETWRDPIALWSDVVRRYSQDYRARNNLGSALESEGRFAEALPHFEEAVRIEPDYARGQNNLGITLHRLGRFDEAVVHYREALRIDPHYADAHKNLGAALHALGNLEASIRHYREAVRLSPQLADAHFGLAKVLAASGRPGESVAALRATLRADPNHAEARRQLSLLSGGPPDDD